jgi:Predicted cobalamin binding protein
MKTITDKQKSIYSQLAEAVADMHEEKAVLLANEIMALGLEPLEAVELGLRVGMDEVGRRFEEGIYFIPETLVCVDAMEAALAVLKPYIKKDMEQPRHRIVIGTVEGDTHDLGKNMVALFLSAAGFQVIDLGRNAKAADFLEKALEVNADVIALSTLMTTTMGKMKDVIALLEENDARSRFQVIIGGKPVSQEFAERIGADGYSSDAAGALRLVRQLTGEKK